MAALNLFQNKAKEAKDRKVYLLAGALLIFIFISLSALLISLIKPELIPESQFFTYTVLFFAGGFISLL
jgi:hypothetical protein